MSEKSEALRLADELDGMTINEFYEALGDEAAAELRRQHAEIESLRREQEEDQCAIRVWRRRADQAEAKSDALLEALKEADDYTRHPDYDWPVEFSRRVSDAIKKAEGGQ